MMFCYLICSRFLKDPLAPVAIAGRWSTADMRVIYLARSAELALLEHHVRRAGAGSDASFKKLLIEIPDDLATISVGQYTLSANWMYDDGIPETRLIAASWYKNGMSALLNVPSAVTPSAAGHLLANCTHPDFKKISVKRSGRLFDQF